MKTLILTIISLSFYSCSQIPFSPKKLETEETREPASFLTCFQAMNEIINYKPYHGASKRIFSNAISLKDLEASYGGESLIEIQKRLTQSEIKLNNLNVRKLLKHPHLVTAIPGKEHAVRIDKANEIYQGIEGSVSNKNHYDYDTTGTIGFCFGRKTIGHMEAIHRGVHPDSVKAIWIAGDMGVWGHHVAPMVYTTDGWRVLDTNLGKIVDTDTWLNHYKQVEGAKDIMAFVTQAGRLGPYDSRQYNALDLFNTNSEDYKKTMDYYNGYFHDYFESLDNLRNPPRFSH